ncbi:MAG: hypothetical protein KKC79_13760 [Gammaproteobacteria bacterium]|nr:hypothetical protein [Gammaproteobacteria bacterium]MBU1440669.1 hypothetical protein [Gammaproteobacteria bacterium]MBU2288471.1 hypothetical protein [Gammaproteobacteria bacterium]MBU2409699.1 hypothetical protein [Gammaproteobacteria bacterium]
MPALLESTFDQFAASAMPTVLGTVLQLVQQAFGEVELRVVFDPDFRQALIGRQLAGGGAEIFALHRCLDAVFPKRVHPEDGNRQVGRVREPSHEASA